MHPPNAIKYIYKLLLCTKEEKEMNILHDKDNEIKL